MATFNLIKAQRKAQAGMSKGVYALLGIVILIVAVTALAPTIFTNTAALEADTNTPSWVSGLVLILAGMGVVFVLLKVIDNK